MIIHGRKDQNVSVEHAYRLEKRLNELNKRVEAWYFDEYTHYFPPAVNRKIVSDLTTWMKSQVVCVKIRMNSKYNASRKEGSIGGNAFGIKYDDRNKGK